TDAFGAVLSHVVAIPAPLRAYTRLRALREEGSELGGVDDRVVAIAVVHEHVDLARRAGQVVDLGHPLAQLRFAVPVAEAFRRGRGAPFPRLRVAAVHAHDAQLAGGRHDGRHRRGETLRLVDAHEGDAVLLEELEAGLALVAGQPAPVPELH